MQTERIHPAVRVGHVHLRVADLDRALAFYRDALGLTLTADGREAGLNAAFLAAGDYHHHIAQLTYDRPRAEWFDSDGSFLLQAERFDFRALLPTSPGDPQ